MASHDRDRAVALSLQLAQAHQELRRQINQLKAELGQRRPDDILSTHCLAFCTALASHHQGEDAWMFAQLLREHPGLEGTIANLVEDHAMIRSILSSVAELARQGCRIGYPWAEAGGDGA